MHVGNPYSLRAPGSANAADVNAAMQVHQPSGVVDFDWRPREHQVLRDYKGWYQAFGNLYAGGRRVHNPPPGTVHPITGEQIASYLERHEKETEDEWQLRRKTAFTLPYPREIVRIYTSTLFRQEVDRSAVTDVLPYSLFEDVDLQAHSAREFLRRAFSLAQVYGWVGVLTDMPPADAVQARTALEQQALGVRPYSRIVLPLRLLYWEREPVTSEFTVALIWEDVDRYRWWFADRWVDVDHRGQRLAEGAHTFGRIPLDILVCESPDDDEDAPFGVSALADVAPIALHVYQMCSLLEDHERRALFAFLHIERAPPTNREGGGGSQAAKAPELHVGSSHYLWVPGAVKWVEPPASVAREAREQILWAVDEMRRVAGVSTRSEESVEAHSGAALAWEYSSRHNAVYERAQHLEDFESRLWRTYGRMLGVDVPLDAVRYPREYAVQPVEAELSEVERLVRLFGGWASTPAAVRPLIALKMRRVAIRDVGHLPDIDTVLESMAALLPTDDDLESLAVDPATALNGAQVTAMAGLLEMGAAGRLPRDTVVQAITAAFPVDEAMAERIVGAIGADFVAVVVGEPRGAGGVRMPREVDEAEGVESVPRDA